MKFIDIILWGCSIGFSIFTLNCFRYIAVKHCCNNKKVNDLDSDVSVSTDVLDNP